MHPSTKGDTENLLAQKLPLLSSRLTEQLKYWEASGSGPKRQATSNKQQAPCDKMYNLKIYKKVYNYRIN